MQIEIHGLPFEVPDWAKAWVVTPSRNVIVYEEPPTLTEKDVPFAVGCRAQYVGMLPERYSDTYAQ